MLATYNQSFPNSQIDFYLQTEYKNLKSYRAINEKCPKDDYPQEDRTGRFNNFEMTVFIREQYNHRKTPNNNTLKDQKNASKDHIEGNNTWRAVITFITSLCTL